MEGLAMKKSLIIAVAIIFAGCLMAEESPEPPDPPIPGPSPKIDGKLKTFSSQEELYQFVLQAVADTDNDASGAMESPTAADDGGSDNSTDNEEITNNQEKGVDEGGLVKHYKDYLIVLRRGRLVSIRVAPDESLTKIDEEEVQPEGLNNYAWYDELLIKNDTAVVIGYRWGFKPEYQRGATELNFFSIAEDGSLSRISTYFIESSDYYSWRNYASRLVENQLVLYMPYYIGFFLDEDEELDLPKIHQYHAGDVKLVGELFKATDVYQPALESKYITFHSVVTCDLEYPDSLDCKSQVIVGPWFHQHYVAQERIYLWVANAYFDDDKESLLYALALDGLSSGIVPVVGIPPDQFSFSETRDGIEVFAVPLEDSDLCEESSFFLYKLPFNVFAENPIPLTSDHYTCLPQSSLYKIRFGPTHLAYGGSNDLTFVNRKTGKITQWNLDYQLTRLELAGNRFAAIGIEWNQIYNGAYYMYNYQLSLDLIDTQYEPEMKGHIEVSDTVESEWRSHGYFFHEEGDSGVIGLASYQLEEGPSIHFFQIDGLGDLSLAGKMEEQAFEEEGNMCTTSCADWYGNTRPIFLGNKVIGLMGDQMSRGFLNSEGNVEVEEHLNIFTGETIVEAQ